MDDTYPLKSSRVGRQVAGGPNGEAWPEVLAHALSGSHRKGMMVDTNVVVAIIPS